MIDADDTLEGKPDFPNTLVADAYTLRIKRGDFTWYRNHIFRLDANWRYEGILHEYAACEKAPFQASRLTGDYHIEARTEGGRNIDISPQEKYLKDAEQLLDALTNKNSPFYQPDNSRYVFYLAQSYFDAGEYEPAKEWYIKRASMAGWEEEVFYSMYRVGICNCILEKPWHECMDAFLQAWTYRPIRAEPLWQLARLYRQNGNPRLGYLFAKAGLDTIFPEQDILFIAHDIWDWGLLDEVAACSYYVHKFDEGLAACNILLQEGKLPKEHVPRIKDNVKHYNEALRGQKEEFAKFEQKKKEMEDAEKAGIANMPPKKKKTYKKRKKQKTK